MPCLWVAQKNILRWNTRPFFASESGKRYNANASYRCGNKIKHNFKLEHVKQLCCLLFAIHSLASRAPLGHAGENRHFRSFITPPIECFQQYRLEHQTEADADDEGTWWQCLAYHAINHKHLSRNLVEFCCCTRRFVLEDMLPRLCYVVAQTPPMRLLKMAEVYG